MLTDASLPMIELKELNSKCLIEISKFARSLHQINGTVIKLQDKSVLKKIHFYYQSVNNAKLNLIYQNLERELRLLSIVKSPKLKNPLVQQNSFDQQPKNKHCH